MSLQPSLLEKIKQRQSYDPYLEKIFRETESKKKIDFQVSLDGVIRLNTRLCVPEDEELKNEIIFEAQSTPYSVHTSTTKMYKDLKVHYKWPGMKKDVVKFVEQCLTYQRIKAEHQRPAGTL